MAVARKPRKLTQCNCSVCRRYGTLWAYYKRSAVTIRAPRGGLATYSVKKPGLRFVRCATCGCVSSWEGKRTADAWMGVNARLLDHAVIARLPISVLDGDRTWKVLERYTKPAMLISPA